MGYADKIRKLCAMRDLDQTRLAEQVGVSKSSMSRILSGMQEPRLGLAHELARALGVSLDYLVDDRQEGEPAGHFAMVTEDELTILKIARRLGLSVAIDRLLGVSGGLPRPQGAARRRAGQAARKEKRPRPRSQRRTKGA
jgi:DNA-binding XRE family transcriptional regulator